VVTKTPIPSDDAPDPLFPPPHGCSGHESRVYRALTGDRTALSVRRLIAGDPPAPIIVLEAIDGEALGAKFAR